MRTAIGVIVSLWICEGIFFEFHYQMSQITAQTTIYHKQSLNCHDPMYALNQGNESNLRRFSLYTKRKLYLNLYQLNNYEVFKSHRSSS